jgi:hypothetical protein
MPRESGASSVEPTRPIFRTLDRPLSRTMTVESEATSRQTNVYAACAFPFARSIACQTLSGVAGMSI